MSDLVWKKEECREGLGVGARIRVDAASENLYTRNLLASCKELKMRAAYRCRNVSAILIIVARKAEERREEETCPG